MSDDQGAARLIGQAVWRQEFMKANPEAGRDEMRERMAVDWKEQRRDYTRVGLQIVRQLEARGYVITKSGEDPSSASM